jgi:hypothetical protein
MPLELECRLRETFFSHFREDRAPLENSGAFSKTSPFVYIEFEPVIGIGCGVSKWAGWQDDCVLQLRGTFSAMGIAEP